MHMQILNRTLLIENSFLVWQCHDPKIFISVFGNSIPKPKPPVKLLFYMLSGRNNSFAPFLFYVWPLCQNIFFKVARIFEHVLYFCLQLNNPRL